MNLLHILADAVGEFVIVILSEAKDLSQTPATREILRFAQNDKMLMLSSKIAIA